MNASGAHAAGRSLLVALNMSASERTVTFDLQAQKLAAAGKGTVLQSNFAAAGTAASLRSMKLPPFGAVMLAVE